MTLGRIATGALATLFLALAVSCGEPAQRVQTDAELQEEARIGFLGNPTIGPVFQRLELHYPDDVQSMLDETLIIYRRGGAQEEAAAVVRATISQILQRDASHISRAEPAALTSIAQTTLSVLQALQREDVIACEEMLVAGDLSAQTRERVSIDVHQALANGTVATLDAIQSGKTSPRTYSTLTMAEYPSLFARSWAEESTRANLRTLMTGDRGALPPEVACETGILMWSDVASAGGNLTERYMSEIMAP